MVYRFNLRKKNKYGDNGWWKETGDEIGHYFTWKQALCGTPKFHGRTVNLQFKNCYDRYCQRCMTIRRTQLRDRMDGAISDLQALRNSVVVHHPSNPRKPR